VAAIRERIAAGEPVGPLITAPASSCYVKLRAWCRVSDVVV
jgi:hypothetical protein